ncbi:isoamyl acetate-hydrolyzing esterase 1 homolog isoform X1 [Gorilla gorilla gorilla]|uniref:isoamyl acetate-hydrolyzing esterase 1 homolog isoform X1 n=2 Tax=Gorilla gorilla gorilla TaxID=9595 RepID=UPI0030092D42
MGGHCAGASRGWRPRPAPPRPDPPRLAAPWRCARPRAAGAPCSGLACCSSGTPSPRYGRPGLPAGSLPSRPRLLAVLFGARDGWAGGLATPVATPEEWRVPQWLRLPGPRRPGGHDGVRESPGSRHRREGTRPRCPPRAASHPGRDARSSPQRPPGQRPFPSGAGLAAAGDRALCPRRPRGQLRAEAPGTLSPHSLRTQFSFQQGGWGASLADRLVRKCDVLNRGFSGYNTRWAKIILPRLIRKGSSLDIPVAVTIFFGANDSALKDENPKQHIPLEEYAANLKSMVQYLKSVDVPENRVILITPTPLCETAWEEQCIIQGCKLNRLNSVVGEYANACLQVAQDCGTDVLDLWTLMQDSQDFSSYLSDGLHLSPKGNEFLFSHLWPLIEKKVSSLPLLLPYWRDVAEAKPELSLLGDGDH